MSTNITIYVRSISNKLFEILIDPSATVSELKQKVSSAVKVHHENLQLLMEHQLLAEESATLFEYDIFDQDILHFEIKECIKHVKDEENTKTTYTHRIRSKKNYVIREKIDCSTESSD